MWRSSGSWPGARGRRPLRGDAAGACELYERALGLWRGQPLEDIGALRGHPAVAGLARQRDDLVIEYAGAAADAGRYDGVVAHLAALTAREPLDERAHAHLIMTLAATGRQAAALRIYQDLVARLDNELGVRPGPELTAAHLHVLQQQIPPAVAGSAPASTPAARSSDCGRRRPGTGGGRSGAPAAARRRAALRRPVRRARAAHRPPGPGRRAGGRGGDLRDRRDRRGRQDRPGGALGPSVAGRFPTASSTSTCAASARPPPQWHPPRRYGNSWRASGRAWSRSRWP